MAKRKDCYTDEEKDEIIAHVLVNVACGRYVSRIFREDETTASGIKLPAPSTFWLWLFQDDTGQLSDKLVRARHAGIEVKLDECEEIADDAINDFMEKHDDKSGNTWWEFQKENVQRSKLRIDTRIQLARMLKPKTYGAKLDLTSGGEQLGAAEALEAARKRAELALNKRRKGDD